MGRFVTANQILEKLHMHYHTRDETLSNKSLFINVGRSNKFLYHFQWRLNSSVQSQVVNLLIPFHCWESSQFKDYRLWSQIFKVYSFLYSSQKFVNILITVDITNFAWVRKNTFLLSFFWVIFRTLSKEERDGI